MEREIQNPFAEIEKEIDEIEAEHKAALLRVTQKIMKCAEETGIAEHNPALVDRIAEAIQKLAREG